MTYIEILLAIVIIAYVSLGFTQVMLNNIKSSKTSRYKTMAYNAAVDWIEENRADWTLLTPLSYPNWNISASGELVPGVPYALQTRISEFVLGDQGKYKNVEVKISWTDPTGEQELTFSTIKAKYD